MRICWVEANKRPPLGRIVAMLQHLLQHKNSPAHTSANNNNNSTTSLDDFERRWELSKPNSVPKIDNQSGTSSMHATPVKPVLLERCASLEENTALGFPPQLEFNASLDNNCIASSNQLSVSSKSQGEAFVSSALLLTQKSPSLQNLRGSVDELNVTETKEGSLDKPLRQGPGVCNVSLYLNLKQLCAEFNHVSIWISFVLNQKHLLRSLTLIHG